MIEQKEATYTLAHGYLQDQHPDLITEFDTIYENLYDTLQKSEVAPDKPGASRSWEGPAFDGSMGGSAIIAVVSFIGYEFAKATIKATIKGDLLPPVLDQLEEKLTQLTRRPKLVSAIRKRINQIIQEM